MSTIAPASIDSPAVREGGRELLSLALMDARNHTLQLLGCFENPPLWLAGHIGWLAEYWIARNPQRGSGSECPADSMRLASIEPRADEWFDPRLAPRAERATNSLPDAGSVKAYLLETLETTLELLEAAPETEAGLHVFRMALFHEDLRGEQLAVLAQSQGVNLPLRLPEGSPPREPMALPAARWRLGGGGPGFAPAYERGTEEVDVPEFEIDAQPVSWAQFVEFIDDGGYDREELWRREGWEWLQRRAHLEGRRGPRHVEQIGVASGAVLQNLFGKPVRMGALQSAMHVAWWEADAYARWARRRLPTEVEWEIAAHAGARRGFRWGDVREWTAGTLRPWAGYRPDPWAVHADLDPQPVFGQARAMRGASFATRARMKYPKARGWGLAEDDEGFVGFRTCAI